MAHSPHAHILEQARLSLAPGHVARRANAYLIALVSRSAAMMTWENHASAIPLTHLSPLTLAGTATFTCTSRADRHATRRPDPRCVQPLPLLPCPTARIAWPHPPLADRPGIGMIINHRTIKV